MDAMMKGAMPSRVTSPMGVPLPTSPGRRLSKDPEMAAVLREANALIRD